MCPNMVKKRDAWWGDGGAFCDRCGRQRRFTREILGKLRNETAARVGQDV
jgi:hypothetical protein